MSLILAPASLIYTPRSRTYRDTCEKFILKAGSRDACWRKRKINFKDSLSYSQKPKNKAARKMAQWLILRAQLQAVLRPSLTHSHPSTHTKGNPST